MPPTPTPTPTPYQVYQAKLAEYMQRAQPTPTPAANYGTAAPAASAGGGGLGAGAGALVGRYLIKQALASGAPATPSIVGANVLGSTAAPSVLTGAASPSMTIPSASLMPPPAVSAAPSSASTLGMSPLAAGGLFIGTAPIWAPVLGKGMKSLSKKLGILDSDPKREYNFADSSKSIGLARQLPDLKNLLQGDQQKALDYFRANRALAVPGTANDDAAKLEASSNKSSFIMPRLTDNDRVKMEEQYGRYWHRTAPLDAVYDLMSKSPTYKQDKGFLPAYKAYKETVSASEKAKK